MVHPKQEEFHKGKSPVPETTGIEEGSPKRNIQRKSDHDPNKDKKQHGGAGGKGKWNELDDGTLDEIQ
ncbi:hypothetical protein MPSEU_000670100 [Mayamaea pseudoterrestris]|nr:hypothetical protein MPSEU_000670100 [Mayamaea pseudoterrestris]